MSIEDRKVFLNYTPHPGQLQVHMSRARFKVVACGRRWGKTLAALAEIGTAAYQARNETFWWVSPTYLITARAWDLWPTVWPTGSYTTRKGERYRQMPSGSKVFFLSADNPESLIGAGPSGVVMDEASRVVRTAWYQSIRPALADKEGSALLISTPRGRGWFFEEHLRGKDPGWPMYESFHASSHQNPFLPRYELEELRATMSDDEYRQEILAEFLEDAGSVFSGIKSCIFDPATSEFPLDGNWILGIDLAKHQDYTVMTLMDADTTTVWGIDRFNKLDWPFQKQRIREMANRYNATIILDSTGIGDVVYDDLLATDMNVIPVRFTSQRKANLIQTLKVAIEQQSVRYPNDEILINELMSYQYKELPSGLTNYSAPDGYHDDCVISLALAVHGSIAPRILGAMI